MILLVRTTRIRKRSRSEPSDLEEGKHKGEQFGHHLRPVKEPEPTKPTFARRSASRVLKALHWKDLTSIGERLRNSFGSVDEKPSSRSVNNVNLKGQGHVQPNHPRSSQASNTRRLYMREMGTGSLRKLENLTGSIIVPTPQPGEHSQQNYNPPLTSISFATDGGTTQMTQSSTDTYARRHYSMGEIIHPLTAPPKPPSKSVIYAPDFGEISSKASANKAKRVSFTQENEEMEGHHIASQFNQAGLRASQNNQHRMSFPESRVFKPLPPTPVVVHGGNDEPEYNASKRRRPSLPPPLLIVQSGSSGSPTGRRSERNKRHSWSGRSVLDLGDSSPTGSDSPPRQSLRIHKSSNRGRRPIPPPKRAYSALPVSTTSSALRFPLQELSRSGYSGHGFNVRMPQVDVAPRVKSMIVETVQYPEPASPSSVSTFDAVMGGMDEAHRDRRSPELGGLSPPPSRPITASTGSSTSLKVPESSHRSSPAQPPPLPKLYVHRHSLGEQSAASTVLSEDSSAANLTEGELILEMQKIKERARRASVERRARRVERERREMQRAEEARSRDKGKGKAKEADK